jgi:hypothetical protein
MTGVPLKSEFLFFICVIIVLWESFQAWPGFLNKTCVINPVHISTVHVSLFMSVNSDNWAR